MALTAKQRSQISGQIRKAKGIIDKYLEEENLHNRLPHIADMADSIGMRESNLKKYFKEYFGMSIYDFYLKHKMEIAKTMLVRQDKGVVSVARTMGYVKASNFIDVFKKFYSVTPGELKRGKI